MGVLRKGLVVGGIVELELEILRLLMEELVEEVIHRDEAHLVAMCEVLDDHFGLGRGELEGECDVDPGVTFSQRDGDVR